MSRRSCKILSKFNKEDEFISFEEQMKMIRQDLEEAKERCNNCLITTKEKKLFLFGCCGEQILINLEDIKQKLERVEKMLELK